MRAPFVLLAGAALSLSVLSATPVFADEQPALKESGGQSSTPPQPSDRVIVRWKAGVDRADRAQVRDEVGADQVTGLGRRFQVMTLADGADPDQAVAALRSSPDVAGAERDGYSVLHANEPNDPMFNQLWGLENKGLNVDWVASSTPGADISALAAWGKTVGDPSVIVADLDDGIRPQHPDLKNRIWNNPGEIPGNGVDDDGNGYIDDTFGMDFAGADIDVNPLVFDNDPTDDIPQGGHGTHTAGTIAAEGNNGLGITGVAQRATIMPIRVCGWSPGEAGVYCLFSSQIAGINYAGANGAKIANMSLGGTTGSTLVRDALAANPQTLFVISAGNDNKNVEVTGQTTYPCSWDPSTSGIPGAVDNVVCVAASNQNDAKPSFSNWGKVKVDLAAPGTETLSTYPWPTIWDERFEAAGWPYAGWTQGGWVRSNAAPLTKWGIVNGTGASPQDIGTTRTTITPAVAVTGPKACKLRMNRIVSLSGGDVANYKIFIDATQIYSFDPTSSGDFYRDFTVPAGAHNVTARFSYSRNGGTTSNGFWLAKVALSCWNPPGSEGTNSYGFLQGTSMAAPHVTGTAALLKAYEPAATTMQLKQALLTSVDPVAQFNPNTGSYPVATGGRLNADKALDAVDALVAPDTTITSAPPATTTETSATFGFTASAQTPVTFECSLDGGAFAGCTSPHAVTGLSVGSHTFQVRARDMSVAANADPSPAAVSWTVVAKVPGKVTGVKVKRKKTKAVITWKPVAGATGYEVRLGKKTAKVSGPKVTLKKLKAKKKYKARVVAVNSSGKSPAVTVKIKKFKAKK